MRVSVDRSICERVRVCCVAVGARRVLSLVWGARLSSLVPLNRRSSTSSLVWTQSPNGSNRPHEGANGSILSLSDRIWYAVARQAPESRAGGGREACQVGHGSSPHVERERVRLCRRRLVWGSAARSTQHAAGAPSSAADRSHRSIQNKYSRSGHTAPQARACLGAQHGMPIARIEGGVKEKRASERWAIKVSKPDQGADGRSNQLTRRTRSIQIRPIH